MFKYGDRVMISAWGGNVRLSDVRRTGTVAKVNRKTVEVWFDANCNDSGRLRSRLVPVDYLRKI